MSNGGGERQLRRAKNRIVICTRVTAILALPRDAIATPPLVVFAGYIFGEARTKHLPTNGRSGTIGALGLSRQELSVVDLVSRPACRKPGISQYEAATKSESIQFAVRAPMRLILPRLLFRYRYQRKSHRMWFEFHDMADLMSAANASERKGRIHAISLHNKRFYCGCRAA